jgi:hypothetical protein
MSYKGSVPNAVGQLGPIRANLPTERGLLVDALRRLWHQLGGTTSLRGYARKQSLSPSSMTRYLNGDGLPTEGFVADLVDAVEQALGADLSDQGRQLQLLLTKAHEASPGAWGNAQRWKSKYVEAVKRASELEEQVRAQ